MQYRPLGTTKEQVSLICLGTMTWGQQNTEAEAHEQLDYALAQGVNFIDTAEMYPVPPMAETQGRTEEYIGTWLHARNCRDKVMIASKVTGRSENFTYLGRGETRLTKQQILTALEGNLKRLQTDYIDLYQLHWPDRNTNYFGQLGYAHDSNETFAPMLEALEALEDARKDGKIRYIGLSNETPWGTMHALHVAEQHHLPRPMSVQNPYNLLNRTYEVGMAEVSIREQCGLLAYSPLAFGTLSGKYLNGTKPEGARLTLFERFQRYNKPEAIIAIQEYVSLAREYELDPAQMALAYVNTRPFVTSNIIGATTMDQLKANIDSITIALPHAVSERIEQIHMQHPNPCP